MSRKSLLALLLVMIMACCAVFTAGAESILPIGDSAFSVSAGVEINQDGFAQLMAKSGQSIPVQPELLNAVISIINNTTIKATVAGKAAQAEVLMSLLQASWAITASPLLPTCCPAMPWSSPMKSFSS